MRYPHCSSTAATERSDRTAQGYRRFRCRECGRGLNERTGSVLNRLQVPSDVLFLIMLWRLRFKLSLRDLAEGDGSTCTGPSRATVTWTVTWLMSISAQPAAKRLPKHSSARPWRSPASHPRESPPTRTPATHRLWRRCLVATSSIAPQSSKQSSGAGPPRKQRPYLVDARLQILHQCTPVLPSPRRGAQLPTPGNPVQPTRLCDAATAIHV
ncbi:hypothetical protein [Azospirillum endophyticum]